MVDGIVAQDVGIQPGGTILLLQIGNFVSLDLGTIGLECRLVLGRALVAALHRQARLLLAPQVEIHFLDLVIAVALGGGRHRDRRHQQGSGKNAISDHAHTLNLSASAPA
jgi:hypothetical protein